MVGKNDDMLHKIDLFFDSQLNECEVYFANSNFMVYIMPSNSAWKREKSLLMRLKLS